MRPIETPETLPGGHILLTQTTREGLTAQQAEVVAVGLPRWCIDPECERDDVQEGRWDGAQWQYRPVHGNYFSAGDWVLLAPRCLVETDEPDLYVCAQDDVLAVLEA